MTWLLLRGDAADNADGQAYGMRASTWMNRSLGVASCALVLGVAACADSDPEVLADPDPAVDVDAGVTEADDATGDGVVIDDFETLDANRDSYLDPDEVAEWRDVQAGFEAWDADADSELDADEINGNVFELYDDDDDGTISETEWTSAAETFYPGEDVDDFDDVDGDGDTELDSDELAAGFDRSALGPAWTEDTLDERRFRDAYFELYDADDDGRVSATEFTDGSNRFGSPQE